MKMKNITISEAETLAYVAGDTDRADLLGRIDALQRALGQAVAALEEIQGMPDRYRAGAARETLVLIETLVPGATDL